MSCHGLAYARLQVPPGLSTMQLVEAEMAKDMGVAVVAVDCFDIKSEAFDYHYAEMPQLQAVREAVAGAVPPSLPSPPQQALPQTPTLAPGDPPPDPPQPVPADSPSMSPLGSPRVDA